VTLHRRDVIAALAGAAAARPLRARAQERIPVIGYLSFGSPDTNPAYLPSFQHALAEAGYVEGKNVAIEYRWGNNKVEGLPALAADLARRQVALIAATGGPPAIYAAKAATTTIPILFTSGADPVASGFVASLARPGGNLTGMSLLYSELGGKRLGLLRDVVPKASVIAFLVNPNYPEGQAQLKDVFSSARAVGQELVVLNAGSESEVDAAFTDLPARKAGGLLVASDPFYSGMRGRIIARAAAHRLPAIYYDRFWVAEGGLMSYTTDVVEMFRQLGIYAARTLKGEKPANLPVMQPTKFELAINMKTAAALGIDVPLHLQQLADEVVE
jgi:putative ABC transport system substrate-binding protein